MRPSGLVLALLALGTPLRAQELEPRAFSPNPTGLTFLVGAFGVQDGEVVTLVECRPPVREGALTNPAAATPSAPPATSNNGTA